MRTPRFASPFASRSLSWERAVAVALVPLTLHALAPRAHAICRVVEPSVDSPSSGVSFDQTTAALFVAAPEVIVDWRCPAVDGGGVDGGADDAAVTDDAGTLDDAGSLGDDASVLDDAGPLGDDAGPLGGALDAGTITLADAGIVRGPDAPPLCPDGSEAQPVVGPVVSLVVQPRVLERIGDAGLVMPVPARPDLAQGPDDMFVSLRAMAPDGSATGALIHEVVTVVEDHALGAQCTDPHYSVDATDVLLAAPAALYGCSASSSDYYRPGTTNRDVGVIQYGDASVLAETIPVSDEYDAVAISASDATALGLWLDDHQFAHSAIDDEAFAAYVGPGRWFVALHVHPRPAAGTAARSTNLRPLIVSWQGTELPITNRLQYDPNGGTLMTDAYVLAPERRDAADGTAVTLSAMAAPPSGMLRGFGVIGGWLTHLHLGRQQDQRIPDSALVASTAGVVTPPPQPTTERTTTVRIPTPCCPGGRVTGGARSFTHERTYPASGAAPPIPEAWLRTSLDASDPICANSGYGSGYGGCGSSSSSSSSSSGSGRSLRGCRVASSQLPTYAPIALALAWVLRRARRRR